MESKDILLWILIVIGISIPPILAVLLDYYFKRKKLAAETEKIQLQNKITKDITYDKLKMENKQKDIKGKIEIFSSLVKLENEIKSKEKITANDQKKLESLEMIKKEFKEQFGENETGETESELKLVAKEPLEKNPKSKSIRNKKRKRK